MKYSRSPEEKTQEIIKRAEKVWGNEYLYDKIEYIDSKTKITIVCRKHGDFQTNPVCKSGCQKCRIEQIELNKIKKQLELQEKREFKETQRVKKLKQAIKSKEKSLVNKRHGKYLRWSQYARIIRGAQDRNLEFDLSIDDIEAQYEKQDKKCALTGIPLVFEGPVKNGKRKYNNASVDRIDSSKGYTVDNIQIVDKRINIAKQTLSQQEFIEMCLKVVQYMLDM